MKGTTVKIEGELEGIEGAKATGQSVAAYLRRVLQQDLERRQARAAAAAFKEFVAADPEEKQWLDQWDGADLAAKRTTREAS